MLHCRHCTIVQPRTENAGLSEAPLHSGHLIFSFFEKSMETGAAGAVLKRAEEMG
jgi:hypothetical protein